MAAEPNILHMRPDDEFVIALKRAAKNRQLVIVKTGEEVIEIGSISTHPAVVGRDVDEVDGPEAVLEHIQDASPTDDADGDPIFGIFGIFSSEGPNDVARDKYRHLADAYLAERE